MVSIGTTLVLPHEQHARQIIRNENPNKNALQFVALGTIIWGIAFIRFEILINIIIKIFNEVVNLHTPSRHRNRDMICWQRRCVP